MAGLWVHLTVCLRSAKSPSSRMMDRSLTMESEELSHGFRKPEAIGIVLNPQECALRVLP